MIPFKGSWTYKAISDFNVSAPENAQDLTELLWAYLGGMVWSEDEYSDLEGIENELNTEEIINASEEASEQLDEEPTENNEAMAETTEEVVEEIEEVANAE